MSTDLQDSEHYQLVEKAIDYLLLEHQQQPRLADVAGHVGLSEYYFQRLFVNWVGISPKRFLQFLTREYMKTLLDQGYSTLDAAYQAGLSGGGRSHELFIRTQAITPAQYKNLGDRLKLSFAFHHSPFGEYLLAVSEHGICHLAFVEKAHKDTENLFREEWALASIREDSAITLPYHQQLFAGSSKTEIPLLLRGTPFQVQVWEALLKIPFGQVTHYQELADAIGKKTAARATASAIARNKIAYLIPCHRVIRKIGDSGEFRWGKARKRLVLAYEGAVNSGLTGKDDAQRQ
ncbi:MAG: 6-O-methylguanine DNA methyltransferase [Gammaproteobacteria bacterium]|nr:6-O-methylguanine DNA methyltransferase [Gammaproteobacteria bacterium]MAY02208.1 6-O-methylguanine DNA methyltransferase [Gammaproteobacteria bacterium]|tara:strand:+ start:32295 stop:33167 length:873 start_codon:yes stop_codon:yes gene_type:complete